MAKCLIAGLPAAGKSTFIGALTYLLQYPVEGQLLKYVENPDDMSYLNRLTYSWLSQQKVDRTTRGFANRIELNVCKVTGESNISLSLPDIAGEDFETIIQRQSEVIKEWSESPDSLLLFINEWPNHTPADAFGITEPENKAKEPPQFTLNMMSVEVKNILLIKELYSLFKFKKIAIGLSSWDLYKQEYISPIELIKERACFLYNFLNHYFPNAYIFGVSAQGGEYKIDDQFCDEMVKKTEKGERAYIVDETGKLSYDLTVPINYLIS